MKTKGKNKKTTMTRKTGGTRILFRNLPFIYFLGGLTLLYIANAHYAERKVRQINTLKKDIEALRWEFNSAKSDFLYQTTPSQLGRDVANVNLSSHREAPKRIESQEKN